MKKDKSEKNTPVRNPEKQEYAYALYMQNVPQKDICSRVDITAATLIKWRENGGWEEKRASKNISIDTIISKTLSKINSMLDSEDFNADAFSKAVSQLKKMKGGVTADDVISVFISYGDWLISKGEDNEFVQKTVICQDKYILRMLKNEN